MDDVLGMEIDGAGRDSGSATQRAYQALRQMIVIGALPASSQLKIEDLKARLGIGASPIREALSLLTSDHLVERVDKKGFRTAPANRENFQEILSLRCVLEERALRASIAAAQTDWEEALVLAHHRMTRQTKDDLQRFENRHKAFHLALLSNCGSPILLRLCSQLYDLNIRYRFLAGQSLSYRKRDVSAEHAAILQAAIDRDADAAAQRLLAHYRDTGAYLSELFE